MKKLIFTAVLALVAIASAVAQDRNREINIAVGTFTGDEAKSIRSEIIQICKDANMYKINYFDADNGNKGADYTVKVIATPISKSSKETTKDNKRKISCTARIDFTITLTDRSGETTENAQSVEGYGYSEKSSYDAEKDAIKWVRGNLKDDVLKAVMNIIPFDKRPAMKYFHAYNTATVKVESYEKETAVFVFGGDFKNLINDTHKAKAYKLDLWHYNKKQNKKQLYSIYCDVNSAELMPTTTKSSKIYNFEGENQYVNIVYPGCPFTENTIKLKRKNELFEATGIKGAVKDGSCYVTITMFEEI